MKSNPYADVTKAWLENWVIGFNFCPFALHPYSTDRIQYVVFESTEKTMLPPVVIEAALSLINNENNRFDTALIICPFVFDTFMEYWDYSGFIEHLIHAEGLEGQVQLATFHPDYTFDGVDEDAITNFTNRSPFPVFHLIKEEDVAKARRFYKDIDQIPDKNIEFLQSQSKEALRNQLRKWQTLDIE